MWLTDACLLWISERNSVRSVMRWTRDLRLEHLHPQVGECTMPYVELVLFLVSAFAPLLLSQPILFLTSEILGF